MELATAIQEVFNFEGTDITFRKNGQVYVSATEMSKAFPEKQGNFHRFWEAHTDFIHELAKSLNINKPTNGGLLKTNELRNGKYFSELYPEMIIVQKGGIPGTAGTWMIDKLAIEFAGWLSPRFKVWMNQKIYELLTKGYAHIDSLSRKEVALMLLKAEEENERLQLTIITQKPKVEYCENVLDSPDTLTTTNIAKSFKLKSAQVLNRILHKHKIQFKSGKTWVLYHEHVGKDWVEFKTILLSNGGTRLIQVWTEKGRMMIYNLLLTHNYIQP
jgi:phage antirepressor YoqD-like protein